jgi:hypothetical protein
MSEREKEHIIGEDPEKLGGDDGEPQHEETPKKRLLFVKAS